MFVVLVEALLHPHVEVSVEAVLCALVKTLLDTLADVQVQTPFELFEFPALVEALHDSVPSSGLRSTLSCARCSCRTSRRSFVCYCGRNLVRATRRSGRSSS